MASVRNIEVGQEEEGEVGDMATAPFVNTESGEGRRLSDRSDELAEEIEQVVFKHRAESKNLNDESERATHLYIALYEVMHSNATVLTLPSDTLYSAFVCMPMIAKSSNYSLTMMAISIKMVFLTIVCLCMQAGLISSLFQARLLLPGLDGVPSLCTYGQDTGAGRRPFGPSGQIYERTFGNVETDYTMVMIRNTLHEVMKKVGVQNDGIGPVEYGMESSTCRVVCAAVFTVAICGEVFSMATMVWFLWYSPTLSSFRKWRAGDLPVEDEPHSQWIKFDELVDEDNTKTLFPLIGKSALDHITFNCNGVTSFWKVASWMVLLARSAIVIFTFWNGLFFLLNTGGIMELILNALALVFIIDLDRLMFTTLARGITKDIMHRLEPLKRKTSPKELRREMNERGIYEKSWGWWNLVKTFVSINRASLILVVATIGGHYFYFLKHCTIELPPLDFTQWLTPSFFEGQTRFFGGWEFVFGAWTSNPTVDWYSWNTTCVPAKHTLHSNIITKPEGCSLPTPWEVTPW